MSVLRTRIFSWHKNFQHKLSIAALPLVQTDVFHQVNSRINKIVPLCTSSSHICLRPQWKKQIRCYLFVRHSTVNLSQDRANYSSMKETDYQQQQQLLSQMNIRLVNENSFLSWCRNAYLSSVVGVAMITEGTTVLAQSAGVGALVVGTMNLFWGTGCHITNLIRLRHVSGMSGFTLALNVLGSSLHFMLWIFVLICYVGFLDETSAFISHHQAETSTPNLEFQQFDPQRK